MANPRPSPYIWVTWLSHLMSGEVACHWQCWFQTHYQLTKKQPTGFDRANWIIDHTRMVEELRRELQRNGESPKLAYHFKLEHLFRGATIGGEVDCLSFAARYAVVYECKTGQPRTSDQVQVMIYMHALSQLSEFQGKSLSGLVVYKEDRCQIPALLTSFAPNLDYFVRLLAGDTPAVRVPGLSCQSCPVTIEDCGERAN